MTAAQDTTLFAWTSAGDYIAYPQYVNVSRKDGKVSIIVRAFEDASGEYPVMGDTSSCTIPDEDLVQLIVALVQELDPALTRIGWARGLLP